MAGTYDRGHLMSDLRIAKRVTIDVDKGDLWIDELRFPFHVAANWSVEDCGGGCLFAVNVGIYADNFAVVQSLEADLQEIRDEANRHRRELGLAVQS